MLDAALWSHRGLIWRGAIADLRHRYAGAGLGALWHVLNPLIQILVYGFVFGRLLHVPVFYVCVGIVAWTAFAEAVTRVTHSFVAAAPYLRKLALPELVYPAQEAVTMLLHLLIGMAILCAVAVSFGAEPHPTWLLLPVPCALFIAFAAALGLIGATVNVFFRDVGAAMPLMLLAWMWLSPVVYIPPDSMLPLMRANPAAWYVTALQELFLEGEVPPPAHWFALAFTPIVLAVFAGLLFTRLRPQLRDVL